MSLVPGFDPRYRQILFVWDLSRARGGRCFGEGWGGCPWHIRREQGKIKSYNFHLLPVVPTISVSGNAWPGRIFCSLVWVQIGTEDDQRFFFSIADVVKPGFSQRETRNS